MSLLSFSSPPPQPRVYGVCGMALLCLLHSHDVSSLLPYIITKVPFFFLPYFFLLFIRVLSLCHCYLSLAPRLGVGLSICAFLSRKVRVTYACHGAFIMYGGHGTDQE